MSLNRIRSDLQNERESLNAKQAEFDRQIAEQQRKLEQAQAAADRGEFGRQSAMMAATPEGRAVLRDAQTALVRDDRQQAIAMALMVIRRGGEDAASAWRFVGGAACSQNQASLATTAYRNLRSPDALRNLVDLCQRNGLPFSNGQFTSH